MSVIIVLVIPQLYCTPTAVKAIRFINRALRARSQTCNTKSGGKPANEASLSLGMRLHNS